MADINSGLPIRSQIPGQVSYDDIIVKLGDGTTPSQLLGIDSSGKIAVKLSDASGSALTSQANGSQRALDVGINVSGAQIDPRAVRALTSADVVTANQGSANTHANGWFIKITDGTNDAAVLVTGELKVAITQPLPTGTNVIGSVNQGTSPWITKDQSDGSVAPGVAAAFSALVGGQYNASTPSLTDGQQAAIQLDSSGKIKVTSSSTDDHNYGAVGATTLRVAAQIGNSSGAADFNNGATSAQTLRVAANLAIAGANVSATNPIPVAISAAPLGTPVNDYNTASGIAAGSTSNHDYAITTSKTLQGKKIWAAASGLMKIEIQISADGITFVTKWVGFNSASTPCIDIDLNEMLFLDSGTGSKVRVIRTNLDKKSMDLYSTISGLEV